MKKAILFERDGLFIVGLYESRVLNPALHCLFDVKGSFFGVFDGVL